jgi:hypothetical protein
MMNHEDARFNLKLYRETLKTINNLNCLFLFVYDDDDDRETLKTHNAPEHMFGSIKMTSLKLRYNFKVTFKFNPEKTTEMIHSQ